EKTTGTSVVSILQRTSRSRLQVEAKRLKALSGDPDGLNQDQSHYKDFETKGDNATASEDALEAHNEKIVKGNVSGSTM
ncbi:hypothetical protein PFISCL1PPCAC_20363, partial [Pristionchus fissidentatus]